MGRVQEIPQPGERHALQIGSQQHAQQFTDRGGAPATLGDEPMRVRERKDTRLVLRDQIGEGCVNCARFCENSASN